MSYCNPDTCALNFGGPCRCESERAVSMTDETVELLPLGGYRVPETVATREHSLHCFACGGALSHSCSCERVTLHRDALASLIYWVQHDTLAALPSRTTTPVDAGLVERTCDECKGDGIAEYIDHMARPCDACRGEGVLHFTPMEAALLDQCAEQQARIAALGAIVSSPVGDARHA